MRKGVDKGDAGLTGKGVAQPSDGLEQPWELSVRSSDFHQWPSAWQVPEQQGYTLDVIHV